MNFEFKDLFVLDIANNHQGSVEHGRLVISEHARVVAEHNVRAAIKFQFRDLDSFIHASALSAGTNKHIDRFLSTRLTWDEFQQLLDCVREHQLLAMCTPFDEHSVEKIKEMGFDIIKVASASASDWPLLTAVAKSGLPVIISTGGLTLKQIDDVISFFEHKGCEFAIMHCVSIYPTPREKFQLNQIEVIRKRHPELTIGWSTHEDPDELSAIQLAYAKGARIFERHVGVATDEVKLNGYSSTPAQSDGWISSWKFAKEALGSEERILYPEEQEALSELQRGTYASVNIEAGDLLARSNVTFAMPRGEGQLPSGMWNQEITASQNLVGGEAIMQSSLVFPEAHEDKVLKDATHDVKALLNEAGVLLPSEFEIEFSHHYGKENFGSFGAVLINIVNREYCKKTIVVLPGQQHPSHFHKLKEETFQVLWGTLTVELEGKQRILHAGETLTVLPGAWHSFTSEEGCVFDEISTTHRLNDSVYKDPEINQNPIEKRKTKVLHWGRFQLGA